MRFRRIIRTAIMAILFAVLGAAPVCFAETAGEKTTAKDVKQEAQEVIQALKGYTVEQRDEAIKKTKAALDNLDNRIDDLEKRIDESWDKMNGAARREARQSLKELRKQRVKVAEWYGSLKSSSADAWEHVKKGFSESFKAIHNAWGKAVEEFGAGE